MPVGSAAVCENLWDLWFQLLVLKGIGLGFADHRPLSSGLPEGGPVQSRSRKAPTTSKARPTRPAALSQEPETFSCWLNS